jgi:hypothetical protein
MHFSKIIVIVIEYNMGNRKRFVASAPAVFPDRRWPDFGRIRLTFGWVLGMTVCVCAQASLTSDQKKTLPPPATHAVDFGKEVRPILEASCIKCHGRGRAKGDFKLDTRATVLKGGQSGPAVETGRSADSYLIELVSGLNPDSVMPQKGSKLTRAQVGVLRAWIDQGLPWDENVSFGRVAPANLIPRKPALPAKPEGFASDNPVDLLLRPYFEARHFNAPEVVEDRVFARRAYLDVIGLLPSREELDAFVEDSRANKRERLIQRLLGDHQHYAEHWLTFWNDALRNDYQGTGYIDGGRKQITPWLYSALARNVPYDKFVAQLINPTKENEGFINGIVWRGVVNASQTPPMQAAQNISQVFMGANLKCASCHDSFINDWTLADAYGMACIYSDGPLEMVHCDKPTGQKAPVKFLYPELGTIDRGLDQPRRRKRLAEIMTEKQNGRLTRTIVNRLWARFLGRGLVEPVDEMDNPAWNQDLLDWLAADLADHGYDLKHTIAQILSSRAYQLPAADLDEAQRKKFEFHGPLVRRMEAEQYLDAVSSLTGVWHQLPADTEIDFAAASDRPSDAPPAGPAANANWIGGPVTVGENAPPSSFYFRKTVTLPEPPGKAVVVCAADHAFKLYVNGKEVATGGESPNPKLVDCRKDFIQGENVIAAVVTPKRRNDDKTTSHEVRAGFLLYAQVRPHSAGADRAAEQVWDFVSDASWMATTTHFTDWEKPSFVPSVWAPAAEFGGLASKPGHLEREFAGLVSSASQYDHVRAALVRSDPLMTELGRPNREQTVTSRSEAATTLQALELTNGSTLAGVLRHGAEYVLAGHPASSSEVVQNLYRQALGRPPTDPERTLAAELGDPIQREGVEDLLWAVIMLPEFQLIY